MTMRPRLYDEAALIITHGRARVRISADSSSGERSPKGRKMGEPHTIDARNESTEGQGNVKSGGRTPQPTIYRSKWEAAYAQRLELELKAGVIKGWWYEPFSLKLSKDKRYKPDFLVWSEAGIEIVEVKGWSKNRRDGLTRLHWAATQYPCFVFRMVWRNGKGWDGQYITV